MDRNRNFEDDGRVIAKMDVEGMPWLVRRKYADKIKKSNITNDDLKQYMISSLIGGICLAVFFLGLAALFIAFCVNVWL